MAKKKSKPKFKIDQAWVPLDDEGLVSISLPLCPVTGKWECDHCGKKHPKTARAFSVDIGLYCTPYCVRQSIVRAIRKAVKAKEDAANKAFLASIAP